MLVELAANVTVGAVAVGAALTEAAVPLPHPLKANRAARKMKTIERIERKRTDFIGTISPGWLEANS
jgi:hypothetical protein